MTNTIDIEWHNLFEPINGLKSDKQNRIRINREVIPIIFIPGILGSRLRIARTGELVWDPDSVNFMVSNFGLFTVTAADRKAFLVGDEFDPTHLAIDDNNATHNKKFSSETDQTRATRGWGGVSWKFYGRFLSDLQSHRWPEPVGLCFEFPVHAFGFNWSASFGDTGRMLRDYIRETINYYRKPSPENNVRRSCEQVILVTHSAGGMVARACLLLCDKEPKNVLGVIHGVQPVTGAPAGYWRMKAGFERPRFDVEGDSWWRFINPLKLSEATLRKASGVITAVTLGTDGEEVTSLATNMPGMLELLPNSHYRDNAGRRQWLSFPNADGTLVNLPERNPYDDIYLKQDVPWRMVDPEHIDPGKHPSSEVHYKIKTPWKRFSGNLQVARVFHAEMEKQMNQRLPEAVQFYSTGIDTSDRIAFTRNPYEPDTAEVYSIGLRRHFKNKGSYQAYIHDDDKLLKSSEGAASVITMAGPNGSGDGTVPDSSAVALDLGPDCTVSIGETGCDWYESRFARGHAGIFSTRSAKEIVVRSVFNMALNRIRTVCREKGVPMPSAS